MSLEKHAFLSLLTHTHTHARTHTINTMQKEELQLFQQRNAFIQRCTCSSEDVKRYGAYYVTNNSVEL